MKRVFDLDDATSEIEVPFEAEVRVWRGGVLDSRSCESHRAALDAYLDQVSALLASGARELAPWVRFFHGDTEVAARPPGSTLLRTSRDGHTETERFSSLSEALLAYNRLVKAWHEQGFRHRPRAWGEIEDRPPPPWEEGASETRGFFRLGEEEIGHEHHLYRSGALKYVISQANDCVEGFRFVYAEDPDAEPWLTDLDLYHRNNLHGPSFVFDTYGRVSAFRFFGEERCEEVISFDERGGLNVRGLTGLDPHQKRIGLWEEFYEDHITHLSYDMPGQVSCLDHFHRDGNRPGALYKRVAKLDAEQPRWRVTRFEDDGQTIERQYDKDDEGHLYGVFTVRAGGEVIKKFTFEDALEPLDGIRSGFDLVPIQRAEERGEPPRRILVPQDKKLRWWVGEEEHSKIYDSHWRACQEAIELMHTWLREDFVCETPWFVWRRKNERVRARIPVNCTFVEAHIEDAVWVEHRVTYDLHSDALLAFNAWVKAREGEGFVFEPSGWNQGWPRPDAGHEPGHVQFDYRPRDDEDGMVHRRVHIRGDELSEELRFGPQRETFDDDSMIDCFYLADMPVGWRIIYRSGKLGSVQGLVGEGGELRGRSFSIGEDGVATSLLAIDGDHHEVVAGCDRDEVSYSRRVYGLEDKRILNRMIRYRAQIGASSTPILTGHLGHRGESQGEWREYRDDGSLERSSRYEDDRWVRIEWYDGDGELEAVRWRDGEGQRDARASSCGALVARWGMEEGDGGETLLGAEVSLLRDERTGRIASAAFNKYEHFRYPPEMFGPRASAASGEWDEHFSELRSAISDTPSRERFLDACRVLERMYIQDQDRWHDEVIVYASGGLSRWPSRLRMAPWLWINKLIVDALPVEALGVASALSFSAALNEKKAQPRMPLLLDWLERLPPEMKGLDGIHLSCEYWVVGAIITASEGAPARFSVEHAQKGLEVCWDEALLDVIMASPLASALGVLDISGATHLPTRHVQELANTLPATVVLHKEAESEATWGDDFEV